MKKLEEKPFALVGVNTNTSDAKTLKAIMDKEKLNWRTFAVGDTISAKWNNPGTPLYYVIDHKGVIRHKWVGYPGEKAIDTALEKLIKDIEAADKTADELNQVLSKASERLGKNEYPADEVTKLGAINIPFDGGHLTDKGLGRFKKDVATMLINYANAAQKANDQKEKIQNLLANTKGGIQEILAQKADPKVHWAVIVGGTPNGPWASSWSSGAKVRASSGSGPA